MKRIAILLAVCLSGCATIEEHNADPCRDLAPGQANVTLLRPNDKGVMGIPDVTWPWVSQHALFAHRADEASIACERQAAGKCTQWTLNYPCTVVTEAPSSSDLMGMMSSPISSALSHATVPVVP